MGYSRLIIRDFVTIESSYSFSHCTHRSNNKPSIVFSINPYNQHLDITATSYLKLYNDGCTDLETGVKFDGTRENFGDFFRLIDGFEKNKGYSQSGDKLAVFRSSTQAHNHR